MSSKSTISKSNYGDVIRTSKLIDASNLRRNETTDNYGFVFPTGRFGSKSLQLVKKRKGKRNSSKYRKSYLAPSQCSDAIRFYSWSSQLPSQQASWPYNQTDLGQVQGYQYERATLFINNMNGNVLIDASKKSQHFQAKNGSERHSSGFKSFLRWFKKDERHAKENNGPQLQELTSSTETLSNYDANVNGFTQKLKSYDSSETLSPPSSPVLDRISNSSCDSVFSTATAGFAFVLPNYYKPKGRNKQPERLTTDHPNTDSYRRRYLENKKARQTDKQNELTLRKKYKLYSSGNTLDEANNNTTLTNQNTSSSTQQENRQRRSNSRSSSENSKDRRSGSYLHVKGKRKAPQPPLVPNNCRTLSPKTTLSRRKKRQAPQPSTTPLADRSEAELQEAISSTSLLEDEDIKAIIDGTSHSLSRNFSPNTMSAKSTYVSPYMKIREERKLANEQRTSKETNKVSNGSAKLDTTGFLLEQGQLRSSSTPSPKLEDKKPPLSPISPRLWYKRTNNDGSPKTIDKNKHKKNKDDILPDISFSRNSIFDTANKFNFFARINEDKKKDAEKRRSGYLPNISELDREAAEIIKKEQEALALESSKTPPPASEQLMHRSSQIFGLTNEENDLQRKSARELISKFEATSVNINRIKINPAFVPRGELFGSPDSKDSKAKFNFNIKENEVKLNDTAKVESKLPVSMKSSFNESLLGMWNCPHCTLENPNWKIICEACQKIKPYEKRYDPKSNNSSPISTTPTPKTISACAFNSPSKIPKASEVSPEKSTDEWDKKTERVLKYFSPTKPTGLSKSASETSVAKELSLSKIPSPNLGFRKNFRRTSDQMELKIDTIDEAKDDAKTKFLNSPPLISTVTTVFKDRYKPAGGSPNLNEVRSARLAHFGGSLEYETINKLIKKDSSPVKKEKSPEIKEKSPEKKATSPVIIKKSPEKIIENPIDLEKQKEIIRGKIREMNMRALAEKYPVIKRVDPPVPEEIIPTVIQTVSIPSQIPLSNKLNEANKLGAIKKVPLKRQVDVVEIPQKSFTEFEEKILNIQEEEKPELKNLELKKPVKVSSSVQTNQVVQLSHSSSIGNLTKSKKLEDLYAVPTTVVELQKDIPSQNSYGSNILVKNSGLESDKLEKLSEQLQSKDGIECFKKTLKAINKSNTNTIAINKMLRDLEAAIWEGKFELAAKLAKDLAKMKVSLSVKKNLRAEAEIDTKTANNLNNFTDICVSIIVEDRLTRRGPIKINISPLSTIQDLKKRMFQDFDIPSEVQKWTINDELAKDDQKTLLDMKVKDSTANFHLFIEKLELNSQRKLPLDKAIKKEILPPESDDDDSSDCQNERVGEIEEAAGGIVPIPLPRKIDAIKGWVCPLCTLINKPAQPSCLACSKSRPDSYKLPPEFKNQFPEDLNKFIEDQPVVVPRITQKNDLNRQSTNRKSTDEQFNILVEPKIFNNLSAELMTKNLQIPPQRNIVMTALTQSSCSPNITRNRYRGVDNFLRKKDTTQDLIIKTNVTVFPSTVNHYQQLVDLDKNGIVEASEAFDCPVCFTKCEAKNGVILRDCLHCFCKECLAGTVEHSEDVEIKCPFIDEIYSCQSIIQQREIKALVTSEVYEKYLAKSLRVAENQAMNTFHCKTPNCKGWCIFEDNVNQFKCPICRIMNCLTCQVIHDGLDCKQFQSQAKNEDSSSDAQLTKEKLQEFIDKGEALKCPTCQVLLMKKWGCDWIKCQMCKTEICWVTRGVRWGPAGKGDTSSGCKCGVNNIKCHPKCNYCH